MGLEAGTYVSELVATNPPSTDLRKQGDDHLRLIKTVLRNTFPNADRAWYMEDYVAKIAAYTVVAADENKVISCSATGGAFTVTLPTTLGTALAGFRVTIHKTDTSANSIQVEPTTGNLNGEADGLYLNSRYDALLCIWSGTAWQAIAFNYGLRYRAVTTTPTTLTEDDFDSLVAVNPAANATINLPPAANYRGRMLYIKLEDPVFNLTIDGDGAETIDGAATLVLTKDNATVALLCNGAGWKVISHFVGSITGQPELTGNNVFTGDNTFEGRVIFEEQELANTIPLTWDMALSPDARVTLVGNRTLSAPTNATVGARGQFRVLQDATGGRTLTWAAEYLFSGAEDQRPDPVASAATIYQYWVRGANAVIMKRMYTSNLNPIGFFKEYNLGVANNNSTQTQAHGLGRLPSLVKAFLKCTAANKGYAINDYVELSAVSIADHGSQLWMNTTNVGVTLAADVYLVSRTTFNVEILTLDDWAVIVRVYE